MKFIINQSCVRIVEAGTEATLLDKAKLFTFPDVLQNRLLDT